MSTAICAPCARTSIPTGCLAAASVGEHGDDQKTARAIMDFVRRGGRLGLVCDLYDRTGLPVPFFGKEARTQAIGAMIARRAGARIWLSRCKRIGTSSRFEIELKELRVPRTANQAEDIRWTHDAHAGAVRGVDPRGARAVDVVEPALELGACRQSRA